MERVNISDGNEPDANDHRHNDKDQKLPVVIADNKGIPLYNGLFDRDRGGEADLPEKMKISAGTPITVNGSTIGYVFFKSMVMRSYNPQEKEFFTSLNRSIGSSLISGFILTLFMGSLLASRFARPVLLMNEAVSRVAEGDLNARVKNENQDEIGSLARNFNRMAGKLQIAEESRQNLLADIAHELRTPVSIIQANLEMIMEGIYQADEVKLKRLYRETTLLTSLISNLRSLSDLDMGMAELSPVSFDLNPMIEECCEKMRPVLEDRNIALDIRLSGDVCITADEDRLAQVVGNLLSNAVKYAPSDSTLHIVSEVVQDSGSNLVKVTVTDEGEGVPEESLEKIFNRFYRVDQSRSRSSGGRGLGLAISRKIIEMSVRLGWLLSIVKAEVWPSGFRFPFSH